MKREVYLLMGLGLMVGSGCSSTSMELRTLDQDIPAALVAQYNKASDKAYVDEGKTIVLPLLYHYEQYVSKTATGFQAKAQGGMPLGLLFGSHEASDFGQDGRLMEYRGDGTLLTGLLLSQNEELKRTNDTLCEGGGWSLLWGAIGFRERTTGERSITLLWLPIPVGRAPRP
jgi:hypothetical protein